MNKYSATAIYCVILLGIFGTPERTSEYYDTCMWIIITLLGTSALCAVKGLIGDE